MSKFEYFLFCASKLLSPSRSACPSCGSSDTAGVQRKYLVSQLRRCHGCGLLFRAPTATAEENAAFYQEKYSQGFTTECPDGQELARLKACRFAGTEKDYSTYLGVLAALGVSPSARILDFGCSWGYGSWQLRERGYRVTSFEISKPRCRYAREKLGLDAHDSLEAIEGRDFDVFFSAHVLEHVPSVSAALEFARSRVKPGGLFVAFTPNGSDPFRRRDPHAWRQLWSMVHPNFLDDVFYRKTFRQPLLASTPYDCDRIRSAWGNPEAKAEFPLDGLELLVATRLE